MIAVLHPVVDVAALTDSKVHLTELIEAIDRRLPQVQRAGEATIAAAAALLRTEALKRIGEIERLIADQVSMDARPANLN